MMNRLQLTAFANRHKRGNRIHQLCGLVLWYSLNEVEKAEPKHQLSKANHFYYLCPHSSVLSLALCSLFCIHYLLSFYQTLVLSVPMPYSACCKILHYLSNQTHPIWLWLHLILLQCSFFWTLVCRALSIILSLVVYLWFIFYTQEVQCQCFELM